MIWNVIFFLLALGIAALCAHIWSKTGKLYYAAIAITIPTLLATLRVYVGTDYGAYVSLDDYYSGMNLWQYITANTHQVEPTFYIFSQVSPDGAHFVMFGIYSLFTNLFSFLAFTSVSKKNIGLMYAVYLLVVFPFSLNGIRQALAAAIIAFLVAKFLLKGRLRSYLIGAVTTMLVHLPVAIAILAPLILKYADKIKRLKVADNKKLLWLALFGASLSLIAIGALIVVKNYGADLVPGRYQTYFADMSGSLNLVFFFKAALLAFMVFVGKKQVIRNDIAWALLVLSVMEIILLSVGFVSIELKRFANYFILFPIMLAGILASTHGRRFNQVMIVAYMIFFIGVYVVLGQSEIFPYNSIFTPPINDRCSDCPAPLGGV